MPATIVKHSEALRKHPHRTKSFRRPGRGGSRNSSRGAAGSRPSHGAEVVFPPLPPAWKSDSSGAGTRVCFGIPKPLKL